MPLIGYKDLTGGGAAFNSAAFIRMRQTHGDSEPSDALIVRIDRKHLHTSSRPEDLIEQLTSVVPLIGLTTPVGLKTWINGARLENVIAAIPKLHHPQANAVLTLYVNDGPTIDQQVQETVDEVKDLFNGA